MQKAMTLILACCLLTWWGGVAVGAQTRTQSETSSGEFPGFSQLGTGLMENTDVLFKTLGSSTLIEPAASTQNPDNAFLNLPRHDLEVELRADMALNHQRLKLVVKPRLRVNWRRWEQGPKEGQDDWDDEWFVNEWLLRWRLVESVFVSYGRENLQWGPSAFMSPSNPFFGDNGQNHPKREVPGMDFARLVWVIDPAWTLSWISNLDEGRQEVRGFEPIHALKLDATADRKYASLIASLRQWERLHVGGYTGWTATDGLMLYTEFDLTQGSDALRPAPSGLPPPLDVTLAPTREHDSGLEALALLGMAYTFELGPTVSAEYTHNSAGLDDRGAAQYYDLRRLAATGLFMPAPFDDLARQALAATLDTGLRLRRQNYLMLQYRQTQILDDFHVILRYAFNLDDSSSQLVPILGYDLNDYFELFFIGSHHFGDEDTEYTSLLEYRYTLGLEFTF